MKDFRCSFPGSALARDSLASAAVAAGLLAVFAATASASPPPAAGSGPPAMAAGAPLALPPGAVPAANAAPAADADAAGSQADAYAQFKRHAEERLATLRLGPPDVSGYRGELDKMSEEQREIRWLQLALQRVDLAEKLAALLDSGHLGDNAKDAKPGAKDQAQQAAAAEEKAKHAEATEAAQRPEPFPKVVQITGASGALKAVLLVPYVGEVTAVAGTSLPAGRRVTRITTDGVFVADPKAGTVPLGYGDAVPLMPPAPAAQQQPPGFAFPSPVAMPPPAGVR